MSVGRVFPDYWPACHWPARYWPGSNRLSGARCGAWRWLASRGAHGIAGAGARQWRTRVAESGAGAADHREERNTAGCWQPGHSHCTSLDSLCSRIALAGACPRSGIDRQDPAVTRNPVGDGGNAAVRNLFRRDRVGRHDGHAQGKVYPAATPPSSGWQATGLGRPDPGGAISSGAIPGSSPVAAAPLIAGHAAAGYFQKWLARRGDGHRRTPVLEQKWCIAGHGTFPESAGP